MKATKIEDKKILSKAKLKKSIKNIICKPDSVCCPVLSFEKSAILEATLIRHKIQIPHFEKLHWKELKLIPKAERPKPPKIPKIDGFIFGLAECKESIEKKKCSAIIMESQVNPKLLIQTTLNLCSTNGIPFICLNKLRDISKTNFGIRTICLGLKINCFQDIQNQIVEFANQFKNDSKTAHSEIVQEITNNVNTLLRFPFLPDDKQSRETEIQSHEMKDINLGESFPYLYRSNKQTRVFKPNPLPETMRSSVHEELGNNYINVPNARTNNYKQMIVKKITSNPNRKRKRVNK